jgi:hypothetical protein
MLIGLIASCLLAADPSLTVLPLGVARPDGLLRVSVQRTWGGGESGPVHLDAELMDGTRILTATGVALADLSTLDQPVILVLTPPPGGSGQLRVRVTATWAGEPGMPRRSALGEASFQTPAAILATATASIARLRSSGSAEPLPWLWAEQISELANGGANAASAGEMLASAGQLDAWLAGSRPVAPHPGRNDLALRDPVDGSVQPWRLHLPAGPGPFPCALVLAKPRNLGKARWPAWDARQVQAALDAGAAVVECYPAGDRRWNGTALRRVALALAEAHRYGVIDPSRGVTLSEVAEVDAPYTVQQPSPSTVDPAWWRSVLAPPRTQQPATGWAVAPFTIVVGTGEHAAAVAANRRLAGSFRAAYAAHAQAVVEPVDDTVDPVTLTGRNLVLIGNPRSNRVLAQLGLQLPFTWDHREASGPDGFRVLRSTGPSLACMARTADGRNVLVLDGEPPSWGDGLPLAGLIGPLALPGR